MENENTTTVASVQNTESYFDGGVFQRLGWKILGSLVTTVTLGICYPFAVCWLYAWEAKHTVIDGRRLKFTGGAGGLFGTWIVCLLLSIVTCGIYAFYVPIKIRRWRESNTFFEDEIPTFDAVQKLKGEKASRFDGGFWQLFGWELLGGLLTLCTLGICYPLAVKMIYSWEQRHKVYCKRRCTFDGTAGSLFGTWILCLLLTIVTIGIYSWWVPIRVKKWQIKHTHLLENDSPAKEQENKGLSEEEIAAKKAKIKEMLKSVNFIYLAGMVLMAIGFFFPIFISNYYDAGINYFSLFDYRFTFKVFFHNILFLMIFVSAIVGVAAVFISLKNEKLSKLIKFIVLVVSVISIVIVFAEYSFDIFNDIWGKPVGFRYDFAIGAYIMSIGWIIGLIGTVYEEIAERKMNIEKIKKIKWFYLAGAVLMLASLFLSRDEIRWVSFNVYNLFKKWIPLIFTIAMIVLSFVKIPKGNLIKVIPIGLLVICRVGCIISAIRMYPYSDPYSESFPLINSVFYSFRYHSYILSLLCNLLLYTGFALSLIGWIKIDLKEIKENRVAKEKFEK